MVREAENRSEFVRRAKDEAGVHVAVISGAEEARLIRLGALQAVPAYEQRHLIIDIGGGSTEFVIGRATTCSTRAASSSGRSGSPNASGWPAR